MEKLVKGKGAIGAGIKNEKDFINFEFELNDWVDPDKHIDWVEPDCNVCTKVECRDNKIVGRIDVSKAQLQYNKGRTPITKMVFVYHKDGEPRFEGAPKTRKKITNKNKTVEKLNIAFVVQK